MWQASVPARLPTETVALRNMRNERADGGTGIQEHLSRGALLDISCQFRTDIHWHARDDDRFFHTRSYHHQRWRGDSDRTDSDIPRKRTRVKLVDSASCDSHRDRAGDLPACTQEDAQLEGYFRTFS